MGCSKKGRCPITAIAVAKGIESDPYVRGTTQFIKQWVAVFPKIEPEALTEAWANMEGNIEGGAEIDWPAQFEPLPTPHMVGNRRQQGQQMEV